MDLRVKLKVKDSDVVFPIVRIPADAPPDDAPPDPSHAIGKGFSLVELERPNAGLMTAVKDLKNFANYLVTQNNKSGLWPISILVGGKMLQIPFDPRRESMQSNNVEKSKTFFKKHFGKE